MLTIDWENGNIHLNAPHLQHLLRSLREWMATIESITQVNTEADKFSKLALAVPPGLMEVTHFVDNQEVNMYVSL